MLWLWSKFFINALLITTRLNSRMHRVLRDCSQNPIYSLVCCQEAFLPLLLHPPTAGCRQSLFLLITVAVACLGLLRWIQDFFLPHHALRWRPLDTPSIYYGRQWHFSSVLYIQHFECVSLFFFWGRHATPCLFSFFFCRVRILGSYARRSCAAISHMEMSMWLLAWLAFS